MYDAGKIVAGLAIFLVVATAPVWFDAATGAVPEGPALAVPEGGACILPAEAMRARHMALLDRWRDDAVRRGKRTAVTADGRTVRRSLTGACLACHREKERFCDRCHDRLAVAPYCWDCHLTRREGGAS